ncbi:DNA-formamidopyrimidine glycosylase family protein [Rhodoluna sp.]|uniref:Fpg/Nei family DNA glycosylase n=1 Tax=Rhodoluna sp. TaxID=1969481 RepID=UPI0025E0BC8C|nr:DNA-formamidopyrimidine glycosylase family protein [Rhodoluna sp.]
MPEGHTVHRIANDFNRLFAKQVVRVTSPQGRFADSAQLISGHQLVKARAIGKQMFLLFDNQLTLRIHLGIYGKWNVSEIDPEAIPDPVGQVRARFISGQNLADLRGPTVCEVLTKAEVKVVEKRLGPDPLNPDRDGTEQERFVQKVLSSKTAIGLLLMNQDVIAGIGNVYRAEILFRAKIDPHRPGNTLQASEVEEIWRDAVDLLKVGVKTGFMITRDELRTKRPKRADRNFVYKREGLPCRVCSTNISIEIMAARKLYFCVGCQIN